MHFPTLLLLCFSLCIAGYALPTTPHIAREPEKPVEVFLFDAPAFPDPDKDGETLVSMEVFVYKARITDINYQFYSIFSFCPSLEACVKDISDRLYLAAGVSQGAQTVTVDVTGCRHQAVVGPTSPDNGLALQDVSVGECEASHSGKLAGHLSGAPETKMTIFPSTNSGFGVISDIDDTVKISGVLHKLELVKTTLFGKPLPVEGMPELYKSLSEKLNKPSFFYITGSPFQLVPFLQGFLASSFPDARGPIFARNLTITDVKELVNFVANPKHTATFKLSQIARVHKMFPNKEFLLVGDSTESDPETYGKAYQEFKTFIKCIWIRRVPGANNSDERFKEALKDVPPKMWEAYWDDDIKGKLLKLDVANGQCTDKKHDESAHISCGTTCDNEKV